MNEVSLVDRVLAGDPRAIARAITLIQAEQGFAVSTEHSKSWHRLPADFRQRAAQGVFRGFGHAFSGVARRPDSLGGQEQTQLRLLLVDVRGFRRQVPGQFL